MGRPLGQHFLFNPLILGRIAGACGSGVPLIVEIGPGPGALTRCLLERAERVVAIELDASLAERLPPDPRLTVIRGDALQIDLSQWGQAVVSGNLPYYISTAIIEKVLALGALLTRAVFLVQKEVAARLTASPGGREYGYLTVATQLFCRTERLFDVRAGAFRPPPKVDSTVVRFTPHAVPLVADAAAFLRFAGACFRQKRKTLRNNLSVLPNPSAIQAQPEAALRAEQLSISQLVDLYGRIRQY